MPESNLMRPRLFSKACVNFHCKHGAGAAFKNLESSPQEMKQVAQHACRCSPNKKAIIRHCIKSTTSGAIWKIRRTALMMHAIHQKRKWDLKNFRHFKWIWTQI